MNTAKTEISRMYDELAATFSALDLANFRKFFHLPFHLTTPDGVVGVADDAAFEVLFGGIMDGLSRNGFTHSVIAESHIAVHGDRLAMASIRWLRYAGGEVLERLGATYTLHKAAGRWGIVALVAHPAQSVLEIDID